MDTLYTHIAERMIQSAYALIGIIQTSAENTTFYAKTDGQDMRRFEMTYSQLLTHICRLLPTQLHESFHKDMAIAVILDELEHKHKRVLRRQGVEVHGVLKHFVISFVYFDETKESLLMAFYDESQQSKEQIQLIQRLIRTEDRFSFLMSHICDDFLEINMQKGTYWMTYANGEASQHGYYDDLIQTLTSRIVPEQQELYRQTFALQNLVAKLRAKNGFFHISFPFLHADGIRYMLIVSAMIQDSLNPDYEYIVSYSQDVTELKKHQNENQQLISMSQQLLEFSQHDALTGLWNRVAAELAIDTYAHTFSTGNYGSLLLIDLDYFKTINDRYGHNMGDSALQYFAQALNDVFTVQDIICRWGGDEFFVFMCNLTDKETIIQRIQLLMDKMVVFQYEDTHIKITLSIGIGIAPSKVPFISLFNTADKALYQAKECGRNTYEYQYISC